MVNMHNGQVDGGFDRRACRPANKDDAIYLLGNEPTYILVFALIIVGRIADIG